MHSIKSIITTTGVRNLCLASNMISGEGIEILRDTLCKNTTLTSLDVFLL